MILVRIYLASVADALHLVGDALGAMSRALR
jgi:hypothetical protein